MSATPTLIQRGALAALGAHVRTQLGAGRVALITDETVWAAHGARLCATALPPDTVVVRLPAGEAHKTRVEWGVATDALLDAGLDRDTVIIALGGGVITDLAGFVAATYLRGVRAVLVPTTLLAMVDAAHGGKTGVDTAHGKNLVGAFHPPSLVVVDPDVLHTLPPATWRDGLAEVLKHGIIADAEYFASVTALLPALVAADGPRHPAVGDLVARSIAIKQAVVSRDPTERGERRTLNFGHTIAHALERVTHYALSHGEAVAIGMVVEARLAHALGLLAADAVETIGRAIAAAGLPTRVPAALDLDTVVLATRSDKKNALGAVRYALPTAIGAMHPADGAWVIAVDDQRVLDALRATVAH